MSESKINNWYFLFKSYPDQVNHLFINRVEAQARKEVACGEQTLFPTLVSPAIFSAGEKTRKSVMVRTCDRFRKKIVDVSCETVIFLALDLVSKN